MHGSASPHKQEFRTLDANLKRRARKLATDSRVDPRTRSLIRYGLQIKDEHLEQVVNRVEAGEMSIMTERPPSPVLVEDKLWILSSPTGLAQYDFNFESHFRCHHPYDLDSPIIAVARMGAAPDYQSRFDSLMQWGVRLIHTPSEYQRTSYLPEWYPLIKQCTPKSIWFEHFPSADEILTHFNLPVFLKGERQTNKHSRVQSIIESREQLENVLQQWKQESILWWQRVVCREYLRLRPATKSPGGDFPKSYEFRTFWWKHHCVGIGKYWVSEDYRLNPKDESEILAKGELVSKALDVTFLVIDFAQTIEGEWIVIECNDGQDSGYAGVHPRFMWQQIIDHQLTTG